MLGGDCRMLILLDRYDEYCAGGQPSNNGNEDKTILNDKIS